jgi:hypothetical protein
MPSMSSIIVAAASLFTISAPIAAAKKDCREGTYYCGKEMLAIGNLLKLVDADAWLILVATQTETTSPTSTIRSMQRGRNSALPRTARTGACTIVGATRTCLSSRTAVKTSARMAAKIAMEELSTTSVTGRKHESKGQWVVHDLCSEGILRIWFSSLIVTCSSDSHLGLLLSLAF